MKADSLILVLVFGFSLLLLGCVQNPSGNTATTAQEITPAAQYPTATVEQNKTAVPQENSSIENQATAAPIATPEQDASTDGNSGFLQNETRITISLPFSKEDEAIALVPMGETVYHPEGHPGIDFGWVHNASVIASAEGVVTAISDVSREGGRWDVEVQSGDYFIRYSHLQDYNTSLKVGSKVPKAGLIGHPEAKERSNYAIHWEMTPAYQYAERLCPLSYFDNESKERIVEIWDKTQWEYKQQFPEICNGQYKGLDSFADILRFENSPEYELLQEQLKKIKEDRAGQK